MCVHITLYLYLEQRPANCRRAPVHLLVSEWYDIDYCVPPQLLLPHTNLECLLFSFSSFLLSLTYTDTDVSTFTILNTFASWSPRDPVYQPPTLPLCPYLSPSHIHSYRHTHTQNDTQMFASCWFIAFAGLSLLLWYVLLLLCFRTDAYCLKCIDSVINHF